MRRKNITGRQVAYWRNQYGWTQKTLSARLQCLGYDLSREMVGKIELGLRGVEDNWLVGFQKVFSLPISELFPPEVRLEDKKLAQRPFTPPPDRQKKSCRRCPKLTKPRKRV